VTLPSWGQFTADVLQNLPGKWLLAGHSMGGMAISQAAEYAPDRISALVDVTALLPTNGASAFDLTRGAEIPGQALRLQIQPSPDGQYITAELENVRAFLYGETAKDWADLALSRIVPQPLAVMRAPAQLSAGRFGKLPRAYIECQRDRVIPVALQSHMQAATPCGTVLKIDTDHSPFYSTPEILAAHLGKITVTYS